VAAIKLAAVWQWIGSENTAQVVLNSLALELELT